MKYVIAILATVLLVSCSVKKRTYRDGYYIDWAFQKRSGTDLKKFELSKRINKPFVKQQDPIDVVIVKRENDLSISSFGSHTKTTLLMDTCGDVITFRSGDQVTVRVTEITEDKIKYKRCDNLDGPDFVVSKATVALIKYANGVEEKIEAPAVITPTKNDPYTSNTNYGPPPKIHPKAWAALLCTVLLFWLFGLGILLGLIFSSMAIKEIKADPKKWRGLLFAQVVQVFCIVILGLVIVGLLLP